MMRRACLAVGCLAAVLVADMVAAATFNVIYTDGATTGFNDPEVRVAVGGNSGTTLGEQRRIAFEEALSIWGAVVQSSVTVEVETRFANLGGSGMSAILGYAGFTNSVRDFAGAPLTSTYYPIPLANALAGMDLDPSYPDVTGTFNRAIDGDTALGTTHFYYGLDGLPGFDIDFLTVALHEVAHGLGFATLININNGAKPNGYDDIYSTFLADDSTGEQFPDMTDGERAIAVTNTGNLIWTGPNVVANSGGLGAGVKVGGAVQMYAPASIESGSSVSHFDTAVSPDELMEPFITGVATVGLAADLLADLGWAVNCGDGVLDAGEECDDGANVGGDGCSADCRVEDCYGCDLAEPSNCSPDANGTSCDDDNPCTRTDECNAGTCAGDSTPLAGCNEPGKAVLVMKDKGPPGTRNKLVWKFIKATQPSFPVPAAQDYTMCVYENGSDLLSAHQIPAGDTNWTAIQGGAKYKYKDSSKNPVNDGMKIVLLKTSSAGLANGKMVVKAKGTGVDIVGELPLTLPVLVQADAGGTCWESTFSAGAETAVKKNDAGQFKAKFTAP